ncbi:MAG: zinc ribbon domain-containing protein [Clostridia bacterium]|nr:zinc ribbon domain-containing protein [Clostridia bacterium]
MTAEESKLIKQESMRQESMKRYGFGPAAMKGIRICAECGMPSAASERKCGECGAKLPRENLFQQYKKRHRFCPRCDTVVADDVQFCPECGTRIQMLKPMK